MSDASQLSKSDTGRHLRRPELALLTKLTGPERAASLSGEMVADMSDGGMGSIRFAPFASTRRYGSTLVDAQFTDADGVLVSVALHADQQGRILELDFWKADFSPLVRYPDPADVTFSPSKVQSSGPVHLSHPA